MLIETDKKRNNMKAHLIQLSDYNIIVSDEDIKRGDLFYNRISQNIFKQSMYDVLAKNTSERKIIASDNSDHNLPSINYNGLEEDFGIVDVKKLASDYTESGNTYYAEKTFVERGFIEGFKKCQELNSNKFSLEDMKQFGLWLGENFKELKNKNIDEIFEESPFSRKQPKIFNIEVDVKETEPIKILKTI